jgi:hypothetical protein
MDYLRVPRDAMIIYLSSGQTSQWRKEKEQKDKQRSTKHTHTTKDRVTRTSLKTGGELRCSGMVGRYCSTNVTHRVNLDPHPVLSHECKVGGQ